MPVNKIFKMIFKNYEY